MNYDDDSPFLFENIKSIIHAKDKKVNIKWERCVSNAFDRAFYNLKSSSTKKRQIEKENTNENIHKAIQGNISNINWSSDNISAAMSRELSSYISDSSYKFKIFNKKKDNIVYDKYHKKEPCHTISLEHTSEEETREDSLNDVDEQIKFVNKLIDYFKKIKVDNSEENQPFPICSRNDQNFKSKRSTNKAKSIRRIENSNYNIAKKPKGKFDENLNKGISDAGLKNLKKIYIISKRQNIEPLLSVLNYEKVGRRFQNSYDDNNNYRRDNFNKDIIYMGEKEIQSVDNGLIYNTREETIWIPYNNQNSSICNNKKILKKYASKFCNKDQLSNFTKHATPVQHSSNGNIYSKKLDIIKGCVKIGILDKMKPKAKKLNSQKNHEIFLERNYQTCIKNMQKNKECDHIGHNEPVLPALENKENKIQYDEIRKYDSSLDASSIIKEKEYIKKNNKWKLDIFNSLENVSNIKNFVKKHFLKSYKVLFRGSECRKKYNNILRNMKKGKYHNNKLGGNVTSWSKLEKKILKITKMEMNKCRIKLNDKRKEKKFKNKSQTYEYERVKKRIYCSSPKKEMLKRGKSEEIRNKKHINNVKHKRNSGKTSENISSESNKNSSIIIMKKSKSLKLKKIDKCSSNCKDENINYDGIKTIESEEFHINRSKNYIIHHSKDKKKQEKRKIKRAISTFFKYSSEYINSRKRGISLQNLDDSNELDKKGSRYSEAVDKEIYETYIDKLGVKLSKTAYSLTNIENDNNLNDNWEQKPYSEGNIEEIYYKYTKKNNSTDLQLENIGKKSIKSNYVNKGESVNMRYYNDQSEKDNQLTTNEMYNYYYYKDKEGNKKKNKTSYNAYSERNNYENKYALMNLDEQKNEHICEEYGNFNDDDALYQGYYKYYENLDENDLNYYSEGDAYNYINPSKDYSAERKKLNKLYYIYNEESYSKEKNTQIGNIPENNTNDYKDSAYLDYMNNIKNLKKDDNNTFLSELLVQSNTTYSEKMAMILNSSKDRHLYRRIKKLLEKKNYDNDIKNILIYFLKCIKSGIYLPKDDDKERLTNVKKKKFGKTENRKRRYIELNEKEIGTKGVSLRNSRQGSKNICLKKVYIENAPNSLPLTMLIIQNFEKKKKKSDKDIKVKYKVELTGMKNKNKFSKLVEDEKCLFSRIDKIYSFCSFDEKSKCDEIYNTNIVNRFIPFPNLKNDLIKKFNIPELVKFKENTMEKEKINDIKHSFLHINKIFNNNKNVKNHIYKPNFDSKIDNKFKEINKLEYTNNHTLGSTMSHVPKYNATSKLFDENKNNNKFVKQQILALQKKEKSFFPNKNKIHPLKFYKSKALALSNKKVEGGIKSIVVSNLFLSKDKMVSDIQNKSIQLNNSLEKQISLYASKNDVSTNSIVKNVGINNEHLETERKNVIIKLSSIKSDIIRKKTNQKNIYNITKENFSTKSCINLWKNEGGKIMHRDNKIDQKSKLFSGDESRIKDKNHEKISIKNISGNIKPFYEEKYKRSNISDINVIGMEKEKSYIKINSFINKNSMVNYYNEHNSNDEKEGKKNMDKFTKALDGNNYDRKGLFNTKIESNKKNHKNMTFDNENDKILFVEEENNSKNEDGCYNKFKNSNSNKNINKIQEKERKFLHHDEDNNILKDKIDIIRNEKIEKTKNISVNYINSEIVHKRKNKNYKNRNLSVKNDLLFYKKIYNSMDRDIRIENRNNSSTNVDSYKMKESQSIYSNKEIPPFFPSSLIKRIYENSKDNIKENKIFKNNSGNILQLNKFPDKLSKTFKEMPKWGNKMVYRYKTNKGNSYYFLNGNKKNIYKTYINPNLALPLSNLNGRESEKNKNVNIFYKRDGNFLGQRGKYQGEGNNNVFAFVKEKKGKSDASNIILTNKLLKIHKKNSENIYASDYEQIEKKVRGIIDTPSKRYIHREFLSDSLEINSIHKNNKSSEIIQFIKPKRDRILRSRNNSGSTGRNYDDKYIEKNNINTYSEKLEFKNSNLIKKKSNYVDIKSIECSKSTLEYFVEKKYLKNMTTSIMSDSYEINDKTKKYTKNKKIPKKKKEKKKEKKGILNYTQIYKSYVKEKINKNEEIKEKKSEDKIDNRDKNISKNIHTEISKKSLISSINKDIKKKGKYNKNKENKNQKRLQNYKTDTKSISDDYNLNEIKLRTHAKGIYGKKRKTFQSSINLRSNSFMEKIKRHINVKRKLDLTSNNIIKYFSSNLDNLRDIEESITENHSQSITNDESDIEKEIINSDAKMGESEEIKSFSEVPDNFLTIKLNIITIFLEGFHIRKNSLKKKYNIKVTIYSSNDIKTLDNDYIAHVVFPCYLISHPNGIGLSSDVFKKIDVSCREGLCEFFKVVVSCYRDRSFLKMELFRIYSQTFKSPVELKSYNLSRNKKYALETSSYNDDSYEINGEIIIGTLL
ncbi:conserved Plasmodium protein, unknown function [Plasmodium berghei]|uniref:Uncharacterized protein n=2 Tax=Plasmodium berghei TaxID=5821 RepID=A0A509AMJ0_PLABA|nr:conserved Plasmodium protein, unknown function [Plasmodium berghei ANKA]CXI49326.1 conserved Plasmodium protein, unknown function [Plasmodium berghei]SCL93996.1 conserved Plasmodium protein, unknown function [Plasmodium berghei]SCM15920.1 conserved Plasmodium protein, unknown function [Plasmodium berghei]SCM17716.1 conserved Plasmodium protein, unknown function [Plasmodium berghei]SCN25888.1 conserved Plasmodium protein, unknown function [Plasmodium berghei]|eukprot:XP_034421845.1 conserved Plasmodium protein, unknown function [Plasmodium berghei ANKA]